MVWKTNFDQVPYQDLIDTPSQKVSNSTRASNQISNNYHRNSLGNNRLNGNSNIIHARTTHSSASVSSSSSCSQRDQSPLTIPLNESNLNESGSVDLDPTTAALVSATAAPKHFFIQNQQKPSKNLANTNPSVVPNGSNLSNSSEKSSASSSSNGSILKKLTNDTESTRSNIQLNGISNTLEHIVQQLDILTQVNIFSNSNKQNFFFHYLIKDCRRTGAKIKFN